VFNFKELEAIALSEVDAKEKERERHKRFIRSTRPTKFGT
jgi:hypothetical protein